MNYSGAFAPCEAVNLNATTTAGGDEIIGSGNVLRVVNSGLNQVFVRASADGSDATAADFAVLPGAVAFLSIPDNYTQLSALAVSGTSDIYYSRGTLG